MKWDFFFYVWLFFLTAFLGWLWEAGIYLFKEEAYVNRGFLSGPWLPIYGCGAVMLELFFHRWKDWIGLTFVCSALLCTLLEYLAGWYLESAWQVKWWDYSQMRWNLHGYVCAASSLLFGIAGVLLVCVGAPLFRSLYRKMPPWLRAGTGLFLTLCFAADAAYSAIAPHTGAGITYR
ncbi:MAG: putative ABC transporter permease [Clostridiales bacterium]|nr:putative ABC transporter permease [Clostridiales bacterium]